MRSHYKIKDSLKVLPFYINEIKKFKKKRKKILQRFLSELPFFAQKGKNLTSY